MVSFTNHPYSFIFNILIRERRKGKLGTTEGAHKNKGKK
jgi:hypothetical protein